MFYDNVSFLLFECTVSHKNTHAVFL